MFFRSRCSVFGCLKRPFLKRCQRLHKAKKNFQQKIIIRNKKRQEKNEFKINGRHLLGFEWIPKAKAKSTQKGKPSIFSPVLLIIFERCRQRFDNILIYVAWWMTLNFFCFMRHWHINTVFVLLALAQTSTVFIRCASLLLSHHSRSADQFNQKKPIRFYASKTGDNTE